MNETTELSGDALNQAVAEEVMGWKLVKVTKTGIRWYEDEHGDMYHVGDSPFLGPPWNPADSIGDAWKTTEAAVNRINDTVRVSVDVVYPASGDTPVASVAIAGLFGDLYGRADGDTVQEAGCRAALAAVRAAKREGGGA